jgi:hypothetical protein
MRQINSLSFNELVEYSKSFEEIGPEALAGKVNLTDWRKQSDAAIVTSLATADKPMITSADPMQAALGVQATMEKVAALGYTSLDGPLLARTFDSAYFAAVERITDKNPALGAYYIERTNEVLGNQQAALLDNINRVANANGFKIQTVNGRSDFFPDVSLMSDAAKKELDTYFGGDVNRAWAANGIVSAGRGGNVTQNLTTSFAAIKGLQATLDTYGSVLAAGDRLNGRLPKQPTEGQPVAALGTNFSIPEEVSKDTEFLGAVSSSSTRLQIEPDWLLRVIDFETGSTWSPKIKNPGSSATGLIQFLESTAKGLGTTTSELASMTRGQQMAYVEKYLQPYKGRLNNFGDVYMAVHWPAGIGKDEGYVMYKKGSAEYDVNSGLDTNGDGTVTRGETLARVQGATGRGEAVPYQDRPFVEATSSFTPVAAAGESNPMVSPPASGPAPVVSGTGFQPAPMATPVETPQITNSNPEAAPQAATPVTTDPALVEFIEGLKKGKQEFASMEDVQAAKAAGTIKAGDIVFVDGRPIFVQ